MTKKILVAGPAWVGDMVMAQTLFKLLKQRDPTVTIDVLAPAWSFPLLARMPQVSSSITMPLTHGQLGLRARYRLGKALRAHHYDQAIVLPNSFKSALVLWFARIPQRTGWRGEMRYGVLNDVRTLDKKRYPLMIERFMALGVSPSEALPTDYPLPELHVPMDTAEKLIKKYPVIQLDKPVLALCPGAEFGPAKQWPTEYYAAVANAKIAAGWQVWLLGSAKDRVVTEQIMQLTENRCMDWAGKTTLEEAIDLLSLSTVVVSNDSGLMHVGAALRKPLVAIYGATSTTFTPPLHVGARIVSLSLECQPCSQRICPLKHHRCMKELLPVQVLNAISSATSDKTQ